MTQTAAATAEGATTKPGAGHAPPVLEVIDLTVRFGGVCAVNGVSLSVPAGEVRGLIGPNGAGKTTFFDMVTGVRAPTSGRILLHGVDITRRPAVWRSRHGIRRTFQRQQPFGWLSVEDNVLAAVDWRGGGGGVLADLFALPPRRRVESQRRARVGAVLEQCGLADLRDEVAATLPIGKLRLLELARAIIDEPQLVVLDEPTSGLEEQEAERFGEIVRTLGRDARCAVLLVEHDIPFVMKVCDRITVLNLGEVIGGGTPAEVSADPVVRAAYLG
jgi:branched-chain amino acid transport system ATP-binding protein